MKKVRIIFVFVIAAVLLSGCGLTSNEESNENKIFVNMEIEKYGTIELELYPDKAPVTVNNFVSLIKSAFFNDLTIRRVVKGVLIQGGMTFDNKIKGEFKANGVMNDIKHERGVISMARSDTGYDTASGQFFILVKDDKSLDGQYAAFGKVIKGMEIVDKISEEVVTEDSFGTVLEENQPIIRNVYIKDGE